MSISARFNHRFRVKASLPEVAEFHNQPASMAAITPPPIRVEFHETPKILAEGSQMAFTLWLGPLPVRWQARIENLSATGFSDCQITGPFSKWVHQHTFIPKDDGTTEVQDQIDLQLSAQPFWWLVGLGFYFGLPFLFKYRAWKTRRMLERGTE